MRRVLPLALALPLGRGAPSRVEPVELVEQREELDHHMKSNAYI